jgi:hypothetical protein
LLGGLDGALALLPTKKASVLQAAAKVVLEELLSRASSVAGTDGEDDRQSVEGFTAAATRASSEAGRGFYRSSPVGSPVLNLKRRRTVSGEEEGSEPSNKQQR